MANQWEQDDRQQQEYWQNLELEIGFNEHLEQERLEKAVLNLPVSWWKEELGEVQS